MYTATPDPQGVKDVKRVSRLEYCNESFQAIFYMPFVQYEVIIIHIFEEIVTFKFWTPHPYTPGGNRSSLFKDILEIAL